MAEFKAASGYPIVVVGGGIAGVSCAESLALQRLDTSILLVSGSPLVKRATNIRSASQMVIDFEVEEAKLESIAQSHERVSVIYGVVTAFFPEKQAIVVNKSFSMRYAKLCICTGAIPFLIGDQNKYIYGIRDTDSVEMLQMKLKDTRRVVVVGNGGIAMEFVYLIKGKEMVWVIRDGDIGSVFLDKGAAQFMLSEIRNNETNAKRSLRARYTEETRFKSSDKETLSVKGSALGPDWTDSLNMGDVLTQKNIQIEYNCEVERVVTRDELVRDEASLEDIQDWPVLVRLTNGKLIGCDMIVSATGVRPKTEPFSSEPQLKLSADGGIMVDEEMCTSIRHVYAAGDVCSVNWRGNAVRDRFWFQMRLWTQALQMGNYAGKCLAAHTMDEPILQDFCFELFTHSTKFFGYPVILLGNFKGEGLDNNKVEYLLRYSKKMEYVKLVLYQERLVGGVLIGDTELAEMIENLILNQLDLTDLKENILNPDIDMVDYFD